MKVIRQMNTVTARHWQALLGIGLLAIIALVLLFVPIETPFAPAVRKISVRAEQFEFSPSRITVNQGDHIIITLSSSDVAHGFALDSYGIDKMIMPGITEQVEFIAGQVGKFQFHCSVFCGALHPFMVGELVVEPNVPYWRAAGFVAMALTAMLVYLWRSTGGRDTPPGE